MLWRSQDMSIVMRDCVLEFLLALALLGWPYLILAWSCSRWSCLGPSAQSRMRFYAPYLAGFIFVVELVVIPASHLSSSCILPLFLAFGIAFSLAIVRKSPKEELRGWVFLVLYLALFLFLGIGVSYRLAGL
jgi:hypothetical protein